MTASTYSGDAISTFKQKDPKHRDFWTKYLVSTLYFGGIHKTPHLIVAPYPGHGVGYDNEVVRDGLITFAKCFRRTDSTARELRPTVGTPGLSPEPEPMRNQIVLAPS